MASSQTNSRSTSQVFMKSYVHGRTATSTGGSTADAYIGSYDNVLDMRDYGACLVSLMRMTSTGGTTEKFKIYAASSTTGANALEIKAHASPTSADAAGDQLFLECTAAEIGAMGDAAGTDLRYLAALVAHNSATDRSCVTFVLSEPRFPRNGLTADIIT